MFYEFNQNNSGGHFDRSRNVDHYVIVEAVDVTQAIDRANGLDIYFNGVAEGMDCECCGDRWYAPWESDTPNTVPSHYDSPLSLANSSTVKNPREHTVVIHYLDGRVIYTTTECGNPELNKYRDLALGSEDESERGY